MDSPEKKKFGFTDDHHLKFMERLKAESIESPLDEWKYIGGDTGEHAERYRKLYPDQEFPSSTGECLCTLLIVENYYLQNEKTNAVLVIGGCCLRPFLPIEIQDRKCIRCHQSHQNKNNYWCNDCQGGVLTVGYHQGRSYRWILEEKPDYGRFILNLDNHKDGELTTLSRWLISNGLTSDNANLKRYIKFDNKQVEPRKSKKQKQPSSYKKNIISSHQNVGFGKYRDKSAEWVLNNDFGYCQWVLQLKYPSPKTKKFQEWLIFRI
jgi:hypothetical protein